MQDTKSKNFSKAHESYPALLEEFMKDYKKAVTFNTDITTAKKHNHVASPWGTTHQTSIK
eukprot:4652125-Ditylum_brightwellii.AAC.1